MKKLNFSPVKSDYEFKENYKLHDKAEESGKNLLVQWGIDFEDFGKDKRNEKVWEGGKDKPDILINYKGKRAFLDWKGKHKKKWILNKRAINSYKIWGEKFNIPVLIIFAVFDDKEQLKEIYFAKIGVHNYSNSEKTQWDKNETVEFNEELIKFNKPNLLKYL